MVKEKRGGTHATITSMILENIYDTREHKANFNDMISTEITKLCLL